MTAKSLLILLILCFPHGSAGTNVRDFGAKGDGVHDDTEAIYKAINASDDGALVFPKGRYRITQTVVIKLANGGPITISGQGGGATIVMDAAGPAFQVTGTHQGSALPATVSEEVWQKERMFVLENLEIYGTHPMADGIELHYLMQPILRGTLIRNVRHGIRLTQRNRNVLLEGNHIYHCSGVGIYLDSVNIHQMIISHSHISYCAEAGIKVRHGEIRNFQITGNDIEYNCSPDKTGSADICIDLSKGGNVREGTIASNTIQAVESPDGANIRFSGDPDQPHKLGLWSIAGNHISNQKTGIWLAHTQGISITGNTFIRAYGHHLHIDNSKNIVFSGNVIDDNTDYFPPQVNAAGSISITNSQHVLLHDNLIAGSAGSTAATAAISITNCDYLSVKNCQITDTRSDILSISDSKRTTISGNVLTSKNQNAVGLSIYGRCDGSIIEGNDLGSLRIENHGRGAKVR